MNQHAHPSLLQLHAQLIACCQTFSEAYKQWDNEMFLTSTFELFKDGAEVSSIGLFRVSWYGSQPELIVQERLRTIQAFLDISSETYQELFTHRKYFEVPGTSLLGQQGCEEVFWVFPVPTHQRLEYFFILSLPTSAEDENLLGLLQIYMALLGETIAKVKARRHTEKSEDFLKIVLQQTPAMHRTIGADGSTHFFNQSWVDFLGSNLSSDTDKETYWKHFVHPDDLDPLEQVMEAGLQLQEPFEQAYRLRRKDGEYRWMLEKVAPIIEQNELKAYTGIAMDISMQRQQLLHTPQQEGENLSEQKLWDSLNHGKVLALAVTAEGRIVYGNRAFYQLSGWKREELIGDYLQNIFIPDLPSEQQGAWTTANLFACTEGRMLTRQGGVLRIRYNPIVLNNEQGQMLSTTLLLNDLTPQERANEELLRSNILLEELFDSSNELMMVFDYEGRVSFVNGAWKRALGYGDEDLKLLRFGDMVASEELEYTIPQLDIAERSEVPSYFCTTLVAKDGKRIFVEGNVNYMESNTSNGPATFRAFFTDITERLRAEKAQDLYYSVAKLVEKAPAPSELYRQFYILLDQTIRVDSFLILLTNNRTKRNSIPFFVNSDFCKEEGIHGEIFAHLASELDRPMFLYKEAIIQLIRQRQLPVNSQLPEVWMGVPLVLEEQRIGMIIVQSFRSRLEYNKRDLQLLNFISGQLTVSIARHQREQQIQDQAARLQAVFESGSHMMWSIDKRGKVTRSNQNFLSRVHEVFGIEPKSDIPILKQLYGKEQEGLREYWRSHYQMALGGIPQRFETAIPTRKKGMKWWQVYLNPVIISGQIEEVSGIALDITDKKNTELFLAESEEKFRNIFETLQDVYFRTNMEGNFTMISPSIYDLTGEPAAEVLGKPITDFYISHSKLNQLIRNMLVHGSVKNFESQIIDKRGHVHHIISNFRLIYDSDQTPIGVEGLARDITELKETTRELSEAKEKAEQLLEAKRNFLSNMSHEIRTPMNGIIGMIDLMGGTPMNQEQQDYVSTIKRSSETLLNILNDILDLSKIEAGKMKLNKGPNDLRATVDKLRALFLQNAQQKGNRLVIEIDERVPRILMIDETRLIQILSNLTSNAIKFTDNGEIRLCIRAQEKFSRVFVIIFEVHDSGVGISKENVELLFKHFSQVEDSYTRRAQGGTGLGLAISQEICYLMNGDIGVESKLGVGSTFWFTIEAEECNELQPLNVQEEQTTVLQTLSSAPVVLVVDDNAVNLKVAYSILSKAGCTVHKAQSAKQTFELIQELTFDIIFMDIQMPEINGIQATRIIREKYPDFPTPIIAMTAFTMQEEQQQFLQAGMDDFLAKPIKANLLIEKVEEWIGKRGLQAKGENLPQVSMEIPAESVEREEKPSRYQQALSNEVFDAHGEIIIDWSVSAELEQYGGKELIFSSMQDFIQETDLLLQDLEIAITASQIDEIRSVVHTIKGSAATLGIEKMAAMCKEYERIIREREPLDMPLMQRNLQHAFGEFKETLIRYLDS